LSTFAENFQESKAESDIEGFVAPKVHENSVFLYQSKALANEIRQFGATEIMASIFVVAAMHQPMFVLPTFGVWYFIYARVSQFDQK
jgi:hypothetical protein